MVKVLYTVMVTQRTVANPAVLMWCTVLLVIFTLLSLQPAYAINNVRFSQFSASEGLSQNTVSALYQDHKGYLWIGTQQGLNRYDGLAFKAYQSNLNNKHSLSDDFITSILEDSQKQLWVATRKGLNRFVKSTERFIRYGADSNTGGLSHPQIESVFEASDETLWVGTFKGLSLYNRQQDRFYPVQLSAPGKNWDDQQPEIRAITEDLEGGLWLGTEQGLYRLPKGSNGALEVPKLLHNDKQLVQPEVNSLLMSRQGYLWVGTQAQGVFGVDTSDGQVLDHFISGANTKSLSHSSVTFLYEDQDNRLWVGTEKGLNILEPKSGKFQRYLSQSHDPYSLSNDHITVIYPDQSGVLWVGTLLGGLNKHVISQQVFSHYHLNGEADVALSSNSIRSFYQDALGALWIGTDNGLNRLNEDRDRVTVMMSHAEDDQSLSSNRIWALMGDEETLWIGTAKNGLNRLDTRTGIVRRYSHDPADSDSIGGNKVRTLFFDNLRQLWVGSWGGGLSRYDVSNDRFITYRHEPSNQSSISDDRVTSVIDDGFGRLWVGTQNGLNLMDPTTGQFIHYQHQEHDENSLIDNRISSIAIDQSFNLWIGTRKGLDYFDPVAKKFTHYGLDEGLLNEVIYSIQIANNGDIWVSTNRGLFRLNRKTSTFTQYNEADGLQNDEFNTRASYKGKNGELFFGGINGFNGFLPGKIRQNSVAPPVVFNDFRLFNKRVDLSSENLATPLSQVIDNTQAITLTYKQSMFSIEFAALHFVDPANNSYQYRLEGFDDTWIDTDATRPFASYTNLDAGHYKFRVRAANKGGAFAERPTTLTFHILPPPWKTWWAYTIYGLVIVGFITAYVFRQQQKLANEQRINQQLRAVDKMKDEFLANTSHELRTPLHGMIGLAESMVSDQLSVTMNKNLEMIVHSGQRLNRLVDQILDFSKLQAQQTVIELSPVNLYAVVAEVLALSQPLLKDKPIRLINDIDPSTALVLADQPKLQQIMHNLIGNAIKFTLRGQIRVTASQKNKVVEIKVEDSGIGIPVEQQAKVFEAFHQADGASDREYGGTGLGLAVTKQLIELHESSIKLNSVPGEGSIFSFTLNSSGQLPEPEVINQDEIDDVDHASPIEISDLLGSTPEYDDAGLLNGEINRGDNRSYLLTDSGNIQKLDPKKRFTILIVDDEPVNRHVLKNYLTDYNFRLLEAESGEQALSLVDKEESIDLVLLDIMMPKMSGYRVCESLRRRFPVNDLPIVFLTAKTQVKDIVDGFSVGGNDYLTKPVAKYELQSRVQTHLQLLDINRDLEEKVRLRTAELEEMHDSLQSAYTSLEEVSLTDPLTGLRNRRYFMKRIESDIKLVDKRHRQKIESSSVNTLKNADLVFYMIDLDHFKQVNDTYGHAAGDAVLITIRNILQEVLRDDDYIVRWGGEEFLVVTRHTDHTHAAQLAERIRVKIEETDFVINDINDVINKTCSIGFAAYPFCTKAPTALSWSQVIDIADMALYAAKHSTRNAWVGVDCIADSINDNYAEIISSAPEDAVARGEIEVLTSIQQKQQFRWR